MTVLEPGCRCRHGQRGCLTPGKAIPQRAGHPVRIVCQRESRLARRLMHGGVHDFFFRRLIGPELFHYTALTRDQNAVRQRQDFRQVG